MSTTDTFEPTTLNALLRKYQCIERSDNVPSDPETTLFKKQARLQQARWRESHGLPIGSQPMGPKPGQSSRPVGSRINLDYAKQREANFLNDDIRKTVKFRMSFRENHQLINEDRLYCDLLSSMPMCFNLFGSLQKDNDAATRTVRELWADVPGEVRAVRFEWSPGRMDKDYLKNKSAFDVAFELELSNSHSGVIGVETKYHEHCKPEKRPKDEVLEHYQTISKRSNVFKPDSISKIVGTNLQQIWLDHLLALSMLQNATGKWKWAKFVLVYPSRNPSYAKAVSRYRDLLSDPSTFSATTIETILDSGVLPNQLLGQFRERYLWQ